MSVIPQLSNTLQQSLSVPNLIVGAVGGALAIPLAIMAGIRVWERWTGTRGADQQRHEIHIDTIEFLKKEVRELREARDRDKEKMRSLRLRLLTFEKVTTQVNRAVLKDLKLIKSDTIPDHELNTNGMTKRLHLDDDDD